jgi:DNA-binding transcriptional ArsR family regulator
MNTDKPDASDSEIEACRRLAATWAPVLRALGNQERLLIALWLAGTDCSVRDLERVTGMKQSLVSYHLQALRTAGLVSMSSLGRSNRYRLARSDLDQLATLIGRLEADAG